MPHPSGITFTILSVIFNVSPDWLPAVGTIIPKGLSIWLTYVVLKVFPVKGSDFGKQTHVDSVDDSLFPLKDASFGGACAGG